MRVPRREMIPVSSSSVALRRMRLPKWFVYFQPRDSNDEELRILDENDQ